MLEPEHLNPKEVLAHLNALGYHYVTPRQLQDFLHDLKKLIKYHQKHMLEGCRECRDSGAQSVDFPCSCRRSCENSEDVSSRECCSSSVITDNSSSLLRESNDELNKPFKCENAPKVQSFIRPRNITSSREKSSRSKKNTDPVSLYHHYKQLWNRYNIPGESSHLQLRWLVRNKMLGQEP